MRTLKKSLALILVFAMILSFGVIGASAAFTDVTSSTKYSEAIDVMAAIGVINGMTTTTFEPDGGLTRAQASKIIAYMLLGSTNAELIKDATAQRFTDVSATHWAAGYIEYCTNLGIIAGVGDNKFDPEGKLTVAAFTKLLLGALGYDAAIENFTGDSWAINVASTAVKADISEDGIPISNTRAITRAEACQLAYLTLQATLVEYENKGTTITVGGIDIVTGASTAKEVTSKTLSNRAYIKGTITASDTELSVEFAEKYFNKLTKEEVSIDGRAGYYWSYNGVRISSFIVDDDILAASGNGTAIAELIDSGDSDYIGYRANTTLTYMYNDVEVDVFDATEDYAIDDIVVRNGVVYKCTTAFTGGTSATWIAGSFADLGATVGVVVKFVDTDSDGRYNVISVVERQIEQLSSDPYTTTSGAVTRINIGNAVNNINVDYVTYPSGLEEDDVIIWYKSGSNYYVEKATEISGTMTSYSSTRYTVAGTAYKRAALEGVEVAGASGTDAQIQTALQNLINLSNYTYYVDSYNNIVFVEGLTTAANLGRTVFVEAVNRSTSFDDNTVEARIVHMDGTRETVEVDKVAKANTAASGSSSNAVAMASATNVSNTAGDDVTAGIVVVNLFYTYTKNSDGSYNLTQTQAAADTAYLTSPSIASKTTNFLTNNGSKQGIVANNSTVFLYKTTGSSFNVYTGISNTRNYNNGKVYVLRNGGTALAVVAIGGTSSVGSSSYDQVFVTGSKTTHQDDDNANYYQYTVVKNGVTGQTFYSYDELYKGVLYLCDDDYETYDGRSILAEGASSTANAIDDVEEYNTITDVTQSGGVITVYGSKYVYASGSGSFVSGTYSFLLNSNYKIFVYDGDTAPSASSSASYAAGRDYATTYISSTIYTVETSSSDDSINYVYIYLQK